MSGEFEDDGLEMRVNLGWNDYNTGLFTDKLYRHVRNGDFDCSIDANPGSLVTEFAIGISITLSVELTKELALYIIRRHRDEQERREERYQHRAPPSEITITGDNNEINIMIDSNTSDEQIAQIIESIDDDDESSEE